MNVMQVRRLYLDILTVSCAYQRVNNTRAIIEKPKPDSLVSVIGSLNIRYDSTTAITTCRLVIGKTILP